MNVPVFGSGHVFRIESLPAYAEKTWFLLVRQGRGEEWVAPLCLVRQGGGEEWVAPLCLSFEPSRQGGSFCRILAPQGILDCVTP